MRKGLILAGLALATTVSACGGGPVSIAEACTSGASYPKCQNARLVAIAVEAARR